MVGNIVTFGLIAVISCVFWSMIYVDAKKGVTDVYSHWMPFLIFVLFSVLLFIPIMYYWPPFGIAAVGVMSLGGSISWVKGVHDGKKFLREAK